MSLPSISALKFVQGAAIELANKSVVIECWATWCPPCVRTIPHLNALSKQYTNVNFIGLNFGETEAVVKNGIAKYGIQYSVAMDPENCLGEYTDKVQGIPHAFVFHDNKCIYSGHPGEAQFEEAIKVANK